MAQPHSFSPDADNVEAEKVNITDVLGGDVLEKSAPKNIRTKSSPHVQTLQSCDKDTQLALLLKAPSVDYHTCGISAFKAYQKIKSNQGSLVDIRSEEHYQKVSIPGSLNISGYSLKHKSFLKKNKIFLIDEGGQVNRINDICHKLRSLGFDASYVKGGLNAWKKLRVNFSGHAAEVQGIDELDAEHFVFKNLPNDLLLVNLGHKNQPIIEPNTSSYLQISGSKSKITILKAIKKALQPRPDVARIFIYDDDGQLYPALKHYFNQNLSPSVFYLKGGYAAYQKYYAFQTIVRQSKKRTVNSFMGCRG